MSYLVRMYKESPGGYYSDTVFESGKIFVPREDRECYIFTHLHRLKSRRV